MVGGAMGFVDVPGPPALSSSEVAQELARVYRELLSPVEESYMAIIVKRMGHLQNLSSQEQVLRANQQSGMRQGSSGSNPPSASPRNAPVPNLPNAVKQLGMSTDQMMALGLTPEQHRNINEQRQKIAELARQAQLQGDPEAQARLQQGLIQLTQLSQKPGMNADNMALAGISPDQLEKARARVWKMYKESEPARGDSELGQSRLLASALTSAFHIGLAPLPAGSENEKAYSDFVQRSKLGVSQFDRLLTIMMARNPTWDHQDHVRQAFASVSVSLSITMLVYS
jgi:hypothetical protein